MVVVTPAGTRLNTGRTRHHSAKVLQEPPKQLVQLGLLLYLHQVGQLLCDRNICIQVAQAKAMNLCAPLSQLPGTCPGENWLVVGTLESCAGSWGYRLLGWWTQILWTGFQFLPDITTTWNPTILFAHPKSYTSPKSMTLVTEDIIALHCWKNN